MSIKVRFLANTRDLIGKAEIDLQMDAAAQPTARGVLMAVAKAENKDLSRLLRAGEGGSWSAIRVVRNGQILHSLDGQVADGDVLVVVPMLGAG
jgi:molybdopterin converting factor small subunit